MNSNSEKSVITGRRNGTFKRYTGLLRLRSSILSNSVKILGVIATCFLLEACYGAPRSSYNKLPAADRSSAELARKKQAETKNVSHDATAVTQETAGK